MPYLRADRTCVAGNAATCAGRGVAERPFSNVARTPAGVAGQAFRQSGDLPQFSERSGRKVQLPARRRRSARRIRRSPFQKRVVVLQQYRNSGTEPSGLTMSVGNALFRWPLCTIQFPERGLWRVPYAFLVFVRRPLHLEYLRLFSFFLDYYYTHVSIKSQRGKRKFSKSCAAVEFGGGVNLYSIRRITRKGKITGGRIFHAVDIAAQHAASGPCTRQPPSVSSHRSGFRSSRGRAARLR